MYQPFVSSSSCISSRVVETVRFGSKFKGGGFFSNCSLVGYSWLSAFTNQRFCFFRNQNSTCWSFCSFVGRTSLGWVSVLFIPMSFSPYTDYLHAALLLPLSFRVVLLLADLAGSSLLGGKEHHFVRLQCWKLATSLYTLSRYPNSKAKGSTILI